MRKKWMSSTLALVLAGTTVASMMPAVPVSAKGAEATSGTTYYVDSKKGKDSTSVSLSIFLNSLFISLIFSGVVNVIAT